MLRDYTLRRGWTVDFGNASLGDLLLGLACVRGLADAHPQAVSARGLLYRGPRARLLARSDLPLTTEHTSIGHVVQSGAGRMRWLAVPSRPPTWLDRVSTDVAEVHAALPMRYYLEVEQGLGVRLPAPNAPLPSFSTQTPAAVPFHVVFVATTSNPERKDYGLSGFAHIAATMVARTGAPWRFTVITPPDPPSTPGDALEMEFQVLVGIDALDCLDVCGSAELVVGNDTGLTHLAALCQRADGSGPHVVGLYARHGHLKWTTGTDRHHAIATRFSQMMSVADACPVRDCINDAHWVAASDLTALSPDLIATFAGHCAGWW